MIQRMNQEGSGRRLKRRMAIVCVALCGGAMFAPTASWAASKSKSQGSGSSNSASAKATPVASSQRNSAPVGRQALVRTAVPSAVPGASRTGSASSARALPAIDARGTKSTYSKDSKAGAEPRGKGSRSGKAAVVVAADSASQARAGRLLKVSLVPRMVEPPKVSIGQAIGLHQMGDPLDLRSSVAMVLDQQSGQTLFQKNAEAVLPIASITKVMTAMVVLDAAQDPYEVIEITTADRDTERFSGSRLPIGSKLSRAELMQLALMSSENRAAHALGRSYPGGIAAFVPAMNAKARSIGMDDSRFSDPTGLSSGNISNARDLARMVRAAHGYPQIRRFSTATDLTVELGPRPTTFRSTNRLVDDPGWEIGLQKTGYISEAGKCLVMQARVDSRPVIIVLLDAAGSQSRFADAQRLRKWLLEQAPVEVAPRKVQLASDRS